MLNDQQVLEERVRDIIMAIVSGMVYLPSDTMIDKIKSSPEPIEQKVEELEKAEKTYKDTRFGKLADELMKTYKGRTDPKMDTSPLKQVNSMPDVDLKEMYEFIYPYEIYTDGTFGGKGDQKDLLQPYLDSNKKWTIGIGHLIGNGSREDMLKFVKKYGRKITEKQAHEFFNTDIVNHYNRAKRRFAKEWSSFSIPLKKALIDISFRGDMVKKDSPEEFKFIGYLRRGEFEKAANEYRDHKEYKAGMAEYEAKSEQEKKSDGKNSIVRRIDRNYEIMKNEKNNVRLQNKQ